jgi:hypothetical protein
LADAVFEGQRRIGCAINRHMRVGVVLQCRNDRRLNLNSRGISRLGVVGWACSPCICLDITDNRLDPISIRILERFHAPAQDGERHRRFQSVEVLV